MKLPFCWNPLPQAIMGVQSYLGRNRLDLTPQVQPSPPREAKKGRVGPKWEEGHACRIHDGERQIRQRGCRSAHLAGAIFAREFAADRYACRLRHFAMWRLRRSHRWHCGEVLQNPRSAMRLMRIRSVSNSTEIFVGARVTTTSSKPSQRELKQWPKVAHARLLNNIKNSGRDRHERDRYRRGGAPKRRSPLYHRQGSIHR